MHIIIIIYLSVRILVYNSI